MGNPTLDSLLVLDDFDLDIDDKILSGLKDELYCEDHVENDALPNVPDENSTSKEESTSTHCSRSRSSRSPFLKLSRSPPQSCAPQSRPSSSSSSSSDSQTGEAWKIPPPEESFTSYEECGRHSCMDKIHSFDFVFDGRNKKVKKGPYKGEIYWKQMKCVFRGKPPNARKLIGETRLYPQSRSQPTISALQPPYQGPGLVNIHPIVNACYEPVLP